MKEQNFGARAHKDAAMQKHHPTKMRFGNFANALLFKLPLVAARNPQFRKPPDPNEHQQGDIRKRHGHCSRSISAVNPGPNAISRP